MAVVSVDSIAHYMTQAQGNTKVALCGTLAAGTGAFGAYSSNEHHFNFVASAQREVSFWFNPTNPTTDQWVHIYDAGTLQVRFYLYADGHFQVNSGPSTLIGNTAANVVQFGVQHHCKISVLHHASAGTVDIVLDGVNVLALTGKNTAPSGNAQSTQAQFYGVGGASIFSHFLICDTIGDVVGQPRLGALFPDGAGNYAQWIPSAGANWQNVDEVTPNEDTDYNASDTVNDKDSYAMQNTAANVGSITGLAVTIRMEKTDATARTVAAFLRISGTDYVHGTAQAVAGSYGYLQWVWTLNPNGSIPWTKAVVDALEAGVKVIS